MLLGFAMGLQSIVGTQLQQTNVVFTTTLIKIMAAAFGSTREESKTTENKTQNSCCRRLPGRRGGSRNHHHESLRVKQTILSRAERSGATRCAVRCLSAHPAPQR